MAKSSKQLDREIAESLKNTTAAARLKKLIGDAEVIETDKHTYRGHTILVATLVGDADSDGEEYYSDDVAVAWDSALDSPGDVGANFVESHKLATWLAGVFPATTKNAGFLRDGSWINKPIQFGMRR